MGKKTLALPMIAGGTALILLSGRKKRPTPSSRPRWGIQISKNCDNVKIVDSDLFHKFMFGAFNELVEVDPTLSLIQMTDALFGDVAPDCSGFPEDPESAEVAELYAIIARNIGRFMVEDDRVDMAMGQLIDEATQASFIDWYRHWRNYPSSNAKDPPSDQVSFSSDFSSIKIGDDWYEDTVVPFVFDASESGNLDEAFENFVDELGVLVGQFVVPISTLPHDEGSVIQFFNELESAIEDAKKEIISP